MADKGRTSDQETGLVKKEKELLLGMTNSTLKYLSIGILIVQNTALVLAMRYSRIKDPETLQYLPSTAVVVSECIKMIICLTVIASDFNFNFTTVLNFLYQQLFVNFKETAKVSVPAILYTIQNNLLYLALSNLNAATFQVTYQLKILTTALFSVCMLKKKLFLSQWLALAVLTGAVALVQWPSGEEKADEDSDDGQWFYSTLIGLTAIFLSCISSGFSGVYFEKMLKGSKATIWLRNVQLGIFSLIFGFAMSIIKDHAAIRENGYFQGYNFIVIVVILLQAAGGLIVAAVIKYADNILKGFATAISIIVSSLVSYFLLNDFNPSSFFIIGAFFVILATLLYSVPQSCFDHVFS